MGNRTIKHPHKVKRDVYKDRKISGYQKCIAKHTTKKPTPRAVSVPALGDIKQSRLNLPPNRQRSTPKQSVVHFDNVSSPAKVTAIHDGLRYGQMNPHISIPRQHGGTPNFGGTTPAASRSEGLRMPRFFKRCVSGPSLWEVVPTKRWHHIRSTVLGCTKEIELADACSLLF